MAFSGALFDAAGKLIANAPHMLVHLGPMGERIKMVNRQAGTDLHSGTGKMQPGDGFEIPIPGGGGLGAV